MWKGCCGWMLCGRVVVGGCCVEGLLWAGVVWKACCGWMLCGMVVVGGCCVEGLLWVDVVWKGCCDFVKVACYGVIIMIRLLILCGC